LPLSFIAGGHALKSSAWGKQLRAAMLAAEQQDIPGGKSGARLIKLPPGVPWPQLGAVPLFVRSFYEDCYAHVMHELAPGRRFLVRGNGGGE
jgi:hypothetical protein